jgi:hypothetical protein
MADAFDGGKREARGGYSGAQDRTKILVPFALSIVSSCAVATVLIAMLLYDVMNASRSALI